VRIFLFFLTLTFLFFSCKKEDDSVQAVALPNAYGEGVYILTDQDVNYIDSDNILKENIFNSVNGGSILNPKRLKIKNDKVLITGNRIYMLDINTFGLEAEVGGFINATDCDFVSFNRLFVTDRGDGYVKVVDLDNLHITNQIESGDSSRPAFIVSDYTRSFILNGGIDSIDKAETLINEFDGVMLGRLIQNNPFILKKVDKIFYNEKNFTEINEEIVSNYFEYIKPKLDFESIFRLLSPILQIFFGIPNSKKFKLEIHELMKKNNLQLIESIFLRFLREKSLS